LLRTDGNTRSGLVAERGAGAAKAAPMVDDQSAATSRCAALFKVTRMVAEGRIAFDGGAATFPASSDSFVGVSHPCVACKAVGLHRHHRIRQAANFRLDRAGKLVGIVLGPTQRIHKLHLLDGVAGDFKKAWTREQDGQTTRAADRDI
jgi:hypothetical protein